MDDILAAALKENNQNYSTKNEIIYILKNFEKQHSSDAPATSVCVFYDIVCALWRILFIIGGTVRSLTHAKNNFHYFRQQNKQKLRLLHFKRNEMDKAET